MKTLEKIQNICKIFGVLAKIAMILSFVWAGSALILLLCGIAWRIGGNVFGMSMETAFRLTQTDGLNQMIAKLLSGVVCALTDGFLFFFAYSCLQKEQTGGTPFTTKGAERVRSLGIKTIVMPLVAVIISAVIYECFGVKSLDDLGNGADVVLGIALILFSLVLQHGAELRGK